MLLGRGCSDGPPVTCDPDSPTVTARARRGSAVADAGRTQRGPARRQLSVVEAALGSWLLGLIPADVGIAEPDPCPQPGGRGKVTRVSMPTMVPRCGRRRGWGLGGWRSRQVIGAEWNWSWKAGAGGGVRRRRARRRLAGPPRPPRSCADCARTGLSALHHELGKHQRIENPQVRHGA
jgi:hypothetical protein